MKKSRAARSRTKELFPLFLKLQGRRIVVVGAGRVAEGKIAGLLRCGAVVKVVAPRATARVRAWARSGILAWKRARFQARHLRGAFLVVAATSTPAVQRAVYQAARHRGILCNSVDDPGHCDFYYPAVVRRGELQIAISTAGQSPALAQRLRKELERQFGPEYGSWLAHLGKLRERLLSQPMPAQRRRRFLRAMASQRSYRQYIARSASAWS